MASDAPEDLQRWTAKRAVALVTSILRGETSAQEAARKHGLTVAEVEDWKEKLLFGAENALRSRPRDDEEQQDENRRLKRLVADLTLDKHMLQEVLAKNPEARGKQASCEMARRALPNLPGTGAG